MTARAVIEARLGHPLPPTKELRPDERRAILGLGLRLEALRRQSETDKPDYLAQVLEG